MNRSKILAFGLLLMLAVTGCATSKKDVFIPAYDKVHSYPMAYDFTYLSILNLVSGFGEWEIETTSKEMGEIQLRNIQYSSWDDADNRVIVFLVKRLDRDETTLEIKKNYQQVAGGAELIESIDHHLDQIVATRKAATEEPKQ